MTNEHTLNRRTSTDFESTNVTKAMLTFLERPLRIMRCVSSETLSNRFARVRYLLVDSDGLDRAALVLQREVPTQLGLDELCLCPQVHSRATHGIQSALALCLSCSNAVRHVSGIDSACVLEHVKHKRGILHDTLKLLNKLIAELVAADP